MMNQSILSRSRLNNYVFFITPSHACSYLSNQAARMVFLDPNQSVSKHDLSELSRQGFRRSGAFVYRPECSNCQQCVSSRIRVATFTPNTSQKRTLKANRDLRLETRPCQHATEVHYALFARYIETRHRDGDMYPPTPDSFYKFIVENCSTSFFLEFWKADKLLGACVCDPLDDGLSAVYSFFEPALDKRSLGTFLILQQIAWIKAHNLPYLYLGYWVKDSPKMRYKTKFSSLEVFHSQTWLNIEDTDLLDH